ESYFRLLGAIDVETKAEASVARSLLHAVSVYVADDSSSPYGKFLAAQFAKAFTTQGGTVIGTSSVSAQNLTASVDATVSGIVNAGPNLVYFAGSTTFGAGALKAALVARGSSVPMLSSDNVAGDPQYIQQAGAAAVNTYATSPIPDRQALTSLRAQDFISAYT